MSKAPVVTELPLQNVRFLFGTMVDLRMLPQVLEQTGNAEVGEFKLVAHFPEADKASGNEAAYLARHKGFGGGDYNTYHGDPYKLDEIIWDASGRAGIHLVTKTKYGQVVEFPTIPDKNDSAELMLIVSEYVESIKTPPLIVRCSGMGGSISPLGNKKYQLNLSHGTTKCPTKIKDHVPKKYHAEDSELIPHVGGPSIFSAEDLSPAERSLISNTISNQMQGYYRTGVIGTEPVIGAYPDGPMSIAKRTPEAKQEFFREPAVQDEDGYWNKGPNRWQANKIARGVAYGQLEKSREMGALNPGYKHRGSSGRFRRNPFIFNAEELGCCFCGSDQSMPSQYGTMCGNCAIVLDKIITTNFALGLSLNQAGIKAFRRLKSPPSKKLFTPLYHAEDKIRTTPWNPGQGMEGATFDPLPFEDFAAERKLMCAEHDDYFNACGCGSKNAEDIPVWNDGVVEWETSGPMSPTGSAYSSASVPPTGVMPSPGDTFLNYTDAQNNLVESSGGLWGAEESSAKSVEDLIIQIDNGEDVFLHHLTKNQIDALSDHYSGSEIRSCFTCSVLTDDWDLISEGYECGTCSEGNRTDYEKRKYDGHLGPFGAEEESMTDWDCQYCGHNRKTTHQHRNPNPTLADEVCSSCGVNADFEAEEESTPVMDPMEFGEPVNWIPLDGTPSLKRRKNAESDGRICCDDKMQSFGGYGQPTQYHCVICGSTEGGFGQLRSESFEAMAVISPKNAKDVEKATAALKKRYKGLKIKRVEHIVNRKGSSNKYHIFIFTNKGIFNVYGRIGVTMNIFGPMSKAEGDRKFDRKLKQGYREL